MKALKRTASCGELLLLIKQTNYCFIWVLIICKCNMLQMVFLIKADGSDQKNNESNKAPITIEISAPAFSTV